MLKNMGLKGQPRKIYSRVIIFIEIIDTVKFPLGSSIEESIDKQPKRI